MSIASVLAKFANAIGILSFLKTPVDKALIASADEVLKKYGPQGKAFVLSADAAFLAMSDSDKLFDVATKLVALIAADGFKAPVGVAVIAAERIYQNLKSGALTDLNSFLAVVKN